MCNNDECKPSLFCLDCSVYIALLQKCECGFTDFGIYNETEKERTFYCKECGEFIFMEKE